MACLAKPNKQIHRKAKQIFASRSLRNNPPLETDRPTTNSAPLGGEMSVQISNSRGSLIILATAVIPVIDRILTNFGTP